MAYEKALSLISGGGNALIVTLNGNTANASYNDILAAFKAHTPVYLDYALEGEAGAIYSLAPCYGVTTKSGKYNAVFATPTLFNGDPVATALEADSADEPLTLTAS